jgi:uncharacterized protein YcfJ
MKSSIAVPFATAILAAPAAAFDYVDTAVVVSTVPIYEQVVEPRQQCWTENVTVYSSPQRSATGGIIGGIAGGILGAQVGKGSGRVAAAATGAAIGALVGDRLDNSYTYAAPVNRPVERCHVTESVRTVISGYQVTYRYGGRNSVVILPYDPGPTVQVGVQIVNARPAAHHIDRRLPPGIEKKQHKHGKRHPVWY